MHNTQPDDLPSIAGVLAPVVAGFPRQQQKLLIAWAERQAATRYRFWAEQVGTQERAGFLRCAAREEDIAARIEALDPDAAAIRQQLLAELPDLEAQVLAVYADRALEAQWEIQRRGERAGKKNLGGFRCRGGRRPGQGRAVGLRRPGRRKREFFAWCPGEAGRAVAPSPARYQPRPA